MTTRQFIDAFDQCTSHGWLTWDEGLLLVIYAELTKGPIIEVGSYMGRSATLLAHLDRPVYCIDPWDDTFSSDMAGDEVFARFMDNTQKWRHQGLINPVRKRVEDWNYPITAGFVYLDGDHTYEGTVRQIGKALLCHPTYIAVHDYPDPGIQRACTELLGRPVEQLSRLAVFKGAL